MGTAYTICNFYKETVVEEDINNSSLSKLRIKKDELAKKVQREQKILSFHENEIKELQETVKKGENDLKTLKGKLFDIDNKLNEIEINEASEMIEKLKGLGFDVYKKDSVEQVYIHFPEEEKIFGIKGKMIYNNEPIGDRFNDTNFEQLFDKKLKIIDIPEEEIDAHTKMNHWLKKSFDRLDGEHHEKKVNVVFASTSGVEILSKIVFIKFERMNKEYKTEDLKPYFDITFQIRGLMAHEL